MDNRGGTTGSSNNRGVPRRGTPNRDNKGAPNRGAAAASLWVTAVDVVRVMLMITGAAEAAATAVGVVVRIQLIQEGGGAGDGDDSWIRWIIRGVSDDRIRAAVGVWAAAVVVAGATAAAAVVVAVHLGDDRAGARDFVLEKISCVMMMMMGDTRPKCLTGRRR